jgi:hypothetical protein
MPSDQRQPLVITAPAAAWRQTSSSRTDARCNSLWGTAKRSNMSRRKNTIGSDSFGPHRGAWLAAAGLAAIVSGCGGGTGVRTHSDEKPLTKAEASAGANTVNLSEADVPGWIRRESGGEFKLTRAYVEGARCAGGVDPHRILINRHSPLYHRPQQGSMYSTVLVWPTAALAAKNANAGLSPRGLACFTREEPRERTYKENGAVVRQVRKSLTRLPDPLPRASSSFEFRTIWTNHYPAQPHFKSPFGTTIPIPAETGTVYEDELGFLLGPAQVFLVTLSSLKAMSPSTEQDAFMTIYERAVAHKL